MEPILGSPWASGKWRAERVRREAGVKATTTSAGVRAQKWTKSPSRLDPRFG